MRGTFRGVRSSWTEGLPNTMIFFFFLIKTLSRFEVNARASFIYKSATEEIIFNIVSIQLFCIL